jgi:epoxyqueuosine reductase
MKKALPRVIANPANSAGFAMTNQELFTGQAQRPLKEQIKTEARRLGFTLVGVTTPERPPHFGVYQDWLEADRHGEMDYLATGRAVQRRAELRQILPECRSILVLGFPHFPPAHETTEPAAGSGQAGKLSGRVAAYAWGEDYHAIIPPRLEALVAYIEAQVGHAVANRWYTDTGPILERDLAQRAGLGWIGKNTCLINPQQGSYILLAEILLGIDLEPDLPFGADRCGSCTRCLEACPTECILPDRTLDARRCISYLTIELKGSVPQELRPKMGDWVFGCDICQQVCPWNLRFAPERGDPALAPRPGAPDPELVQELSLSEEAFRRKFKGSPVKRAKRRGYLRNVAIALGNRRDSAALPALADALRREHEPLVRAHAAWAIGMIGGKAAREALTSAELSEEDAVVLAEIRMALTG